MTDKHKECCQNKKNCENKECNKGKKCCKNKENKACSKTEEIKTLKDELLRSYAELENTKKRSLNEIKLRTDSAKSSFANSIIPVLDNLNRTIFSFEEAHKKEALNNDIKNLISGLKLVQETFKSSLSEQGTKAIESIGKAFDPEKHSAIQQLENTGEKSGTIISEIQTGYTLNGKIIKEAMVVVAK
jgi:molecular chaperone GrpE